MILPSLSDARPVNSSSPDPPYIETCSQFPISLRYATKQSVRPSDLNIKFPNVQVKEKFPPTRSCPLSSLSTLTTLSLDSPQNFVTIQCLIHHLLSFEE